MRFHNREVYGISIEIPAVHLHAGHTDVHHKCYPEYLTEFLQIANKYIILQN